MNGFTRNGAASAAVIAILASLLPARAQQDERRDAAEQKEPDYPRSYRDDGRQDQQRRPNGEPRSETGDCASLPAHSALARTLREIVKPGDRSANGGLGNNMWAVIVDRSGEICTVARSGEAFGDQWPGSRIIAAKKAFAANAFSLKEMALSTANLYFPAQPGGSLYGLETSNPLVEKAVYEGPAENWGTADDPLEGQRIGGVTLFGGGLALYDRSGRIVGAIGLSGDTSCTDHVVAWKVRHALNLDNVPGGVNPSDDDNIVHDIVVDPASGRLTSASGYGHPECGPAATRIAGNFRQTHPTGPDP